MPRNKGHGGWSDEEPTELQLAEMIVAQRRTMPANRCHDMSRPNIRLRRKQKAAQYERPVVRLLVGRRRVGSEE